MKASWSGAEIVTRNGEPVPVILPIDQYEQLLNRAQDAEALARLKNLEENHCPAHSINSPPGEEGEGLPRNLEP